MLGRTSVATTVAAALCLATACTAPRARAGDVVATVYPLAWATERLAGDVATVAELASPGVEPHDIEPSPAQLDLLQRASLVVAIGGTFQPAVTDALRDRSGPTVDALVDPIDDDPHVWLDPIRMRTIVDEIATALTTAYPAHADAIARARAGADDDLRGLDRSYHDGLASCATRTFVTAHAAFGYLAARYDLSMRSVAGLDPEAEPTAGQLRALAEIVRAEGLTTIFTEPLAPPSIAETLARESGASVATLDPIETLTAAQRADGADYLTQMRANLDALRTAMRCA